MTRQPGSPVLHRIAVLAAAFLLLPALAIAACTASVPPPQPLPETPAAAALPPAAGQGPSAPEMPPATPAQPTAAPLPPAARGGSSVSAMPQSTLAPALPAVAPSVEIRGAASTPATGRSPVPSALESSLAQLFAAYSTGDLARLAAFAGQPHIDLAAGTVRVILELERSPEAHPAGPASTAVVTVTGGQSATIEYAPAIAIRPDLAAAIAATGATYETAYGDWVQVLAPFASLPALASLPDIRIVRLPFPAGH